MIILTRDGRDSSFAEYPGGRISSNSQNRIPVFRPDIQWEPDTGFLTGYFNACSLFDRVTQIIETFQNFKQEQKCLINIWFAGYPAVYLETGYLVFSFPVSGQIAEK